MTVDLRTRYLGLDLRSPLVASSSPLTGEVHTARRLAEAGVGAIVLPSLFEEEIVHEQLALDNALESVADQSAEAAGYFPDPGVVPDVAERYLRRLAEVKRAVPVPVIASLNATSSGGWVQYARRLAEAGADALELNIYHVVADPRTSSADIEARDLDLVRAVRAAVSIPLAIKLGPWYSAFAHLATELVGAGANGLVLFNRFYAPDIDLDTRSLVARAGLSSPAELRLPLRWIGILRAELGEGVSIAATSGIGTGSDAIKAIMTGADIAMMASALLRHGPEHVIAVEHGLRGWMEEHEYASVSELRGSAAAHNVGDRSAYERANYQAVLHSWSSAGPRETLTRH
ncbi:MAG: dihydroorotate dehydrogenase-like protein [Chloroflexota bacterium]